MLAVRTRAAAEGPHVRQCTATRWFEGQPDVLQEAGQAAEEAEDQMEAQAMKQWASFMRNSRSMQVRLLAPPPQQAQPALRLARIPQPLRLASLHKLAGSACGTGALGGAAQQGREPQARPVNHLLAAGGRRPVVGHREGRAGARAGGQAEPPAGGQGEACGAGGPSDGVSCQLFPQGHAVCTLGFLS